MKTAIVTGASGFIGTEVVNELVANGYFIYIFLRSKENIRFKIDDDKMKLIEVDLDDLSNHNMKFEHKIEFFYHLAWEGSSGVLRGEVDVQLKNLKMTIDCIKFAHSIGVKRFISTGSLMEYEILQSIKENTPIATSTGIYGLTKLNAHYLSKIVADNLGIDHIWTYLSAYGENDNPSRFVISTLEKLINNEPLDFSEADQWYDFSYVSDTARAIRLLGENGHNGTGYFIGSGTPLKLKDYIFIMKQVTKSNSILRFGTYPNPPIKLNKESFNIDMLTSHTGFVPNVKFEDGVQRIVDWILKNK